MVMADLCCKCSVSKEADIHRLQANGNLSLTVLLENNTSLLGVSDPELSQELSYQHQFEEGHCDVLGLELGQALGNHFNSLSAA